MNKKFIVVGVIVCILIVVGIIVSTSKPVPQKETLASTTPVAQKQFTMAEVAQHNTKDSCYTTVQGKVYDLTPAINTHPGGPDKIASICGIDGTQAFLGKHGGQPKPEAGLAKLQIGVLAQ